MSSDNFRDSQDENVVAASKKYNLLSILQDKLISGKDRGISDALSSFMDVLPNALLITDLKGEIVYSNSGLSNMLLRIGPDVRRTQQIIREELKVLHRNTPDVQGSYTKQIETVNGLLVFEILVSGLKGSTGNITGYIYSFSDITAQYLSDKELKRKHHQLIESQRISHVGSWEYNFETDSFLCSQEFINIIGIDFEPDLNIKRLLVSVFDRQKRLEVMNKYKRIIQSDLDLYTHDITFRNQWGKLIILSDTGKILRDKDGNVLRIYATTQDVSESRMINEELRRSKEKITSLLKALPDRVLVINRQSVFTEYYDNLPVLSQDASVNYRGYHMTDVFNPETSELFLNALDETLKTKQQCSFEYNEGEGLFERWYEVRTSLCNDDEVVFLVREITQRRKSTQELIKAKQKAEESDKLKSSFLANMSHEIRTPLNAMMGFSNLLATEELSESEKKKYASIINKNGDQLTSFLTDLLDFSRIDSGQMKIYKEQIHLNDELDKLYNQFSVQVKDYGKTELQLKLVTPLNDEEALIITDPTRFSQVFSNLLTNALKFTEKGFIELGYLKPYNSKIRFYVKDTGKGIHKEEQEYIFKRFRQSASNDVKKHGGTGLGLAICQSLVDLMGGRIWVESTEGNGATFWFTLPY
ncbi:ATP-binding protein [Saccharicrinis sp. FJH62]|uniref:sensor histidine kinase n=1 Tax=Saccharicrinis sp. FJH62 TaxID=3344657 RepID=UPI0035D4A741